MKTKNLELYPGIACNECRLPLHTVDECGKRYKCTLCEDYDLCIECYNKYECAGDYDHECANIFGVDTDTTHYLDVFITIHNSTIKPVAIMLRALQEAGEECKKKKKDKKRKRRVFPQQISNRMCTRCGSPDNDACNCAKERLEELDNP